MASRPMRNIETFPFKQMYLYLSLVERKVAEFYHNVDKRRCLVWLKWLIAWLSLCFILERSWVALYSDVCQCVCQASVSPDQISTFSNIYRHTSPLLTIYHPISSSTNLYWPSTSQYRHILTQNHQVPLIIHHLMSHAQYTWSSLAHIFKFILRSILLFLYNHCNDCRWAD